MRDRRDPATAPGRPDVGGRPPRASRLERLAVWIECVLDFGDALDVAEIQSVLREPPRPTEAPRRRLAARA